MRITAVRITDYKRVREVSITPDVDRALVLIGGKNGAGKSSTLDALTAAFGGAKSLPGDPVRHGADEARIFVELDGGTFTIDRKIAADGKTLLEVRDSQGARVPAVPVASWIDVAALNAEVKAIAEQQRASDGIGAEVTRLETLAMVERAEAVAVRQRIDRLEAELVLARAEMTAKGAASPREDEIAAAQERLSVAARRWIDLAPRRAQLDADLARADAHNRAVFAAEAQNQRRADVTGEVDKLTAERAKLTTILTTVDERKAEILAGATLPVDGLAIGDDGIELAGVPFAQASDAERWRVALALAIAASPGLDDVWIRDGALLDEDSLGLVAQQATAAGKRVWIERVGVRDDGVIVIQDGKVA